MPHSGLWDTIKPDDVDDSSSTDVTTATLANHLRRKPSHREDSRSAENEQFYRKILHRQLYEMDDQYKDVQMELETAKKDQYNLQLRKFSHPTGHLKDFTTTVSDVCDEEVADLRHDNRNKRAEIAALRSELIRVRETAKNENIQHQNCEVKLNELEKRLEDVTEPDLAVEESNRMAWEQECNLLKSRLRDAREETEEIRMIVNEQMEQLQEYRIKYLEAQQKVEEQKCQMDMMELDNKQVNDQIHIEIQKLKMQFEEKLQDLAPLPEVLKGTQIQLQESQQLQKLAEDNAQQLSKDLQAAQEQVFILMGNLNQEKNEKMNLEDELRLLRIKCGESVKAVEEAGKQNEELKVKLARITEQMSQRDLKLQEKTAECSQLTREVDYMRHDSSRLLVRCKDRADTMKRYLQSQVAELERQLVQTRALCRASQKERDEVRQRMQFQLNSLGESFDLAEVRWKRLQNQVNTLKSSYANLLGDDVDVTNPKQFGSQIIK